MLDLLDSWEAKYIQQLKNYDVMAWSDEEAMLRYPKYSWVYDKELLSKSTGVYTVNLEKELPFFYPVIVKPKKNLAGLSKNCYIAESPDEIEDYQGFIAQEYINGTQGTTDLMIQNGKVKAYYSFITQKNKYDEIKCFTSTPFFSVAVRQNIERILHDYTGIANVEYIDNRIIEVHLRPSLQFYDICGGFISAMPNFINNGSVPNVKREQTYSRVFRTRHDGVVKKVVIPDFKPHSIRSIQLCYDDKLPLSSTDPSLFRKRYMVINGTNLQEIEDFSKHIKVVL